MYLGVETFPAIIEFRSQMEGDRPFIKFETNELTYKQLNDQSTKLASSLSSLGFSKGDTCAVMLPNCEQFMYSWVGLSKLGVIEVPVNTAYKGDLFAHILNQSKCKGIIISTEWIERLLFIQNQLETLQYVIVVGDYIQPPSSQFEWLSFEALLNNKSNNLVFPSITPQDPAVILFTSGTTGPSKGVVLSHSANFSVANTACELMDYDESDCLYSMFPLFHVNARYTTVLVGLIAGARVVLHNRFSASRFWDICRSEGITAFNFMGSMLTILMKQPESEDDRNHQVKKIYGAPTPSGLYEKFTKRFGVSIAEVYGSTELGTAAANPPNNFKVGACGKEVSIYEVEIHDEEGYSVPTGVLGEIVVRPRKSGVMFSGYYGNAEATVKAWENLWFHTGDVGYIDEEGYLYFADRKKDVVRRKGENISSYEVESVINRHPKVAECAIIGVPSELSEEEVMAVIVLKDHVQLDPVELLNYCENHLAHFAVPRYIRVVNEFPRTPSQRIEKYKLRNEGVTADTWDRQTVNYQVRR
ncbi:AMP-binding protein [Ureibacillus acetophenoni]|uniref:Crotonobetaine/carnitine-CoA ligase n=1 Tax=Ureibacillus acetophenoni TaxID=614649 RepID=A0A285UMX0_9BACL|nr:AMP-binding protein [Ureibacillus acetophenoni]SOC43123.1 crotonobetaine/carnitine-CoA ligase [Ureibacillus acetophenoni]